MLRILLNRKLMDTQIRTMQITYAVKEIKYAILSTLTPTHQFKVCILIGTVCKMVILFHYAVVLFIVFKRLQGK